MALTCQPDALAALAKCFKCIGPATNLEVQVYLLCQVLNQLAMPQSCDPNDLAAAAKCFKCQSGNLTEIQTYLLCQIANNPSGGGTGTKFVSALFPVNVTQIANVPHGL